MQYISSRHGTMLIVIAILFIATDTWGHITRAYLWMPSIDIATHILFGAWLTLAFIYRDRPISRLNIFVAVMLVGIGWECLEFVYDHLYALPHHVSLAQHNVGDTIKDVFDNGVGAVISLLVFEKIASEKTSTQSDATLDS